MSLIKKSLSGSPKFFRLPESVFQCAKVAKMLQIMERGGTNYFKNKSLDEIDINMQEIEPELIEDGAATGKSKIMN